jgi:hypothetical protein
MSEWKDNHLFVCNLLRRACILCMFKKFKFNDCTSYKIVVKRLLSCYQKRCSKAENWFGCMIKANTMQKLLGHSQAYSFTLRVLKDDFYTHTHTHTQFVLKKCTVKWPYLVLNITIAPQNFGGWSIMNLNTYTYTQTHFLPENPQVTK